MTLAIGPGTPASNVLSDAAALMKNNSMGEEENENSSSSASSSASEHSLLEEEEDEGGISGGGHDVVESLLHLPSSGDDDDDNDQEGSNNNEEEDIDDGSNEENVTVMAEDEEEEGLMQEHEAAAEEEESNNNEIDMEEEGDLEILREGQNRDRIRENDSQYVAPRNDDDRESGSRSDNSDDDDDDDDDEEMDEGAGRNLSRLDRLEQYVEHIERAQRRRQRRRRRQMRSGSASSPSDSRSPNNSNVKESTDDDNNNILQHREVARSMKHRGCINTACWLDVDWRISTVSHEDSGNDYFLRGAGGFITSSSFSSNSEYYPPTPSSPSTRRSDYNGKFVSPTSSTEFPTQICTSGDDHLVKFWDVAASMGSISPLPGGSATGTPFSSPLQPMRASSELISRWKNYGDGYFSSSSGHEESNQHHLPGIVHPLLTLTTGHRGNVFHVTPVPFSPGKVATCAADGFLRLTDVEVHSTPSSPLVNRARANSTTSTSSNTGGVSSAVILSPEYSSENGESEMSAFRSLQSEKMCFSHTFLNANEGLVCSERGLLHFDLRLPARSQKRGSLVEELRKTCKSCAPWRLGQGNDDYQLESAYVFAGGSGVDVALYDLRMTGGSSGNQAVQRYRPRALQNKSSVAVSGIDLSRNKRELLISYECDQIYTFPIFPDASAAGPTLSDIESSDCATDKRSDKPIPELCSYGGHLNRMTFLKQAKYAGPNDEYICTGSDSGHAWIYEKDSGAVVSFIKADNHTCNGIVPHPSLPYFITYGIDSTAKLWRATVPVDNEVDDSDLGRFKYSRETEYEKSIVVSKWRDARRGKPIDLEDEDVSFLPDEIADDDDDLDDEIGMMGIFLRQRYTNSLPYIGNNLMNLNSRLKKNYFTCCRSVGMGEVEPVKSGISSLRQRVALMKSRFQADRLGLEWNSRTPWLMKPRERILEQGQKEGKSSTDMISYGALADLIPDDPSSWIPFERLMTNPPEAGGSPFNVERYERFFLESLADNSITLVARANQINVLDESSEHPLEATVDSLDAKCASQKHSIQSNESLAESSEGESYSHTQAWDILYQTVSLLKEAGNEALKSSQPLLAAQRYDKAINYCSIAYLDFSVGNSLFLAEHQYFITKNGGFECRWGPLLKQLIMIRLNLSMCFLKEELKDTNEALSQANLSLRALRPFATEKGVVLTGKKLSKKRKDEPHETFKEAKTLQAKAYFRLGSAQLAAADFEEAINSFDKSAKCSKEADLQVEAAVVRKLNEAKRRRKEKKEKERKKFKFMFSSGDE